MRRVKVIVIRYAVRILEALCHYCARTRYTLYKIVLDTIYLYKKLTKPSINYVENFTLEADDN